MIYQYDKHGRRWAVVVPVVLVWAGVFLGVVVFDMIWWLATTLLVFTLPAIWDIVRDSHASVQIWPNRIVWHSALDTGDRSDIDHVRLNRRFDGGMRLTLVHVGGATTRLPPDIAPPVDAFQAALERADIPVQRHPFSII